MIIHLTGNSRNPHDFQYLIRLRQIIHDNMAVVARDWLEVTINAKNDKKVTDWAEIIEANLDAINRADLVIIEATSYGFHQGYQAAVALQRKKPTLILSRNNVSGRSISGLRSKFLTLKMYRNEAELTKIVNKFIKDNTISTKDLRFNFFIDRQIYNYLREVSYETGKNKSEIIRDLLNQEIDKRSD